MIRNKGRLQSNEHALTGLELVILLVVAVVITGSIGYGEISHGKTPPAGAQQRPGMVSTEIVATSNLITDPGGIYGYPAVDGTIDGVPVRFKGQNPAVLGAFELTIQPFMMTTCAIDMGHASVLWVSGTDQEKLSLVQTPVLICPNWTITKKFNYLPLKGADQDLFLEGSEQFTLLVCPAVHAAPYQEFTLTVMPANGEILPLTRTVPFGITPLTNLG
jgi:hypothetical protein